MEASASSPEERRVRALWPETISARALNEAAGRVRFQLGQADRFRAGLIREAGAYEAHIAETLANMGLPAELSALPHVESSLRSRPYSKAGAAGLWSPRSTRGCFMRIDSTVDERMDPYRSTVAAQLLQFNYDLLGTWPLALTAYNHGASGMRRAKEKQGTDDIVTIIRTHQSRTFGFASRNYYVAFLAALEIDRNPEQYFGALTRRAEVKTQPFELPAHVPSARWSAPSVWTGRPCARSIPHSPAAVWSGERYVPLGFVLRLPEGSAGQRIRGCDLRAWRRANDSMRKVDRAYRVRSGDTLSRIASVNGTTVAALMRLNDLRAQPGQVRVGRVLQLPPRSRGRWPPPSLATPVPEPIVPPPTRPIRQARRVLVLDRSAARVD